MPWFGDLSYWFLSLAATGALPEHYRGDGEFQFHRDLGVGFYLQGYFPFRPEYEGVQVHHEQQGRDSIDTVVTPVGNLRQVRRYLPDMAAERRRFWSLERPFEFRSVEPLDSGEPRPGVRHLWFRLTDRCPDDQTLHRCLLAYMSDYHLLETATLPHGLSYRAGEVTLASIDHGMWFHRPVDINDWLLYALESPSSSGSRGFAAGSIFDRQGRLVASTVQEGLMRVCVRPSNWA